jgi:hypothetical protein
MDRLSKPSEQKIHELLSERSAQPSPPPDPIEQRRQLEKRLEEQRYQEWRWRML